MTLSVTTNSGDRAWGAKPVPTGAMATRPCQTSGYKTLAIISSDAEFSATAAMQARDRRGIQNEDDLDRRPLRTPSTSRRSANVNAAAPDFVFVASYPVGIRHLVHGISRNRHADSVGMLRRAIVGTAICAAVESLESALNGVSFTFLSRRPTLTFPGIDTSSALPALAKAERHPLGHYLPPFFYAGGQLIAGIRQGGRRAR